MCWLNIFKNNKKCECLICGSKHQRKDVIEIKYRYGKESIGTAYMCNKCDAKYNAKQEDEDYGESV